LTAGVLGEKDGDLTLVNSEINSSDIKVEGANHLQILNTEILQRRETLSDSCKVTLGGRLINKTPIK
jgi:hypothetical protein